jgi:hypothetical protein
VLFKKYSEICESFSLLPKHINDLSQEQKMAINQLKNTIEDATELITLIANDGKDLPAFIQSKITLAEENITKSHSYMRGKIDDMRNQENEEIGK